MASIADDLRALVSSMRATTRALDAVCTPQRSNAATASDRVSAALSKLRDAFPERPHGTQGERFTASPRARMPAVFSGAKSAAEVARVVGCSRAEGRGVVAISDFVQR